MRHVVPMIFGQKSSDCWHACVQMLYAFRNKSLNLWQNVRDSDAGLDGTDPDIFLKLARDAGLQTPTGLTSGVAATYTWQKIDEWLTNYGPLFCAVTWSTGSRHVVVLTGVDPNGTLYVNDPNPKKGQGKRDMTWLNEKIAKGFSAPILYLP